jgi:predicted ribosomally synthesized peptide with nif11-like leader
MSKQAVMSFILKVNEDKTLFEKVNSLPSSRVESLIDVAHEAGYDFTADEFVNTVLEQSKKSGELKEEDLEQVAGGAVDMFSQASLSIESFSLNFSKFTAPYKKI